MLLLAPTAEPVALAEAKEHLRVTGTDEDTLITALVAAARSHTETWLSRALVRQTHRQYLDAFPAVIRLPISPLISVSSIQYIDSAGNTQTVPAADYQVRTDADVPCILPADGKTWPSTRSVIDAVTVEYVVGYATPFTADSATDTITATAHGYADGDVLQVSNTGGALPAPLDANGNYYVISSTADTFQLALTAGGSAIDLTDTGTGTHFLGAVPTPIRQAMLVLIGHLYENRELTITGTMISYVPVSYEALLSPYQVLRF